jgi:uncharacterized protein YyaL (SSP411 family)
MQETIGPLNHLSGERSLYLRQHAGNPLDWHAWGESAFELARAEERLILLSIGYSSCYWCHVMEDEVFSQADVAEFMNPRYVCIKVDREERPDIDAAYMHAAQLLTGGGGWPLNLWLTPDLKPVYAGTYVPRHDFLSISRQIYEAWHTDRAQFENVGAEVTAAVNSTLSAARPGTANEQLLQNSESTILAHADPVWGGLAARVKFPEPVLWEFLLHSYTRTSNEDLARTLTLTFDRIADGGLYDHIGGGFHRYSTDRQWLVPHFEKMLYDNAQLASLYADASRIFPARSYERVATDTLDFMLREMRTSEGAFTASFDASSGGAEGSYYVWTPEQLRELAGSGNEHLAAVLGVEATPNFADHHGKVSGSVVTRRQPDPAGLFDTYRSKLQGARSQRVAPARDDKVVTAWNAMAILALAKAGRYLGRADYIDAARKCCDFLLTQHRSADGSLLRASNESVPGSPGVLEDYALLALALLDLHTVTIEVSYLERSLELIAYVKEHFAAPEGGYYSTPGDTDLPFARRITTSDTVEPSGNSTMLRALLKAALLTGDTQLQAEAEALLTAFAGAAAAQPLEMSHWLTCASLLLGPYYLVVIAGDEPEPLLEAWRKTPALNSEVVTLSPGFEPSPLQPVLVDKQALDGRATAYVCQHGACQQPTSDPDTLRSQLLAR